MFKACHYIKFLRMEEPYTYEYEIIDTNFTEAIVIHSAYGIIVAKDIAVLSCYEKRGLNVAVNFALFLKCEASLYTHTIIWMLLLVYGMLKHMSRRFQSMRRM